jgi:hypothetical protein
MNMKPRTELTDKIPVHSTVIPSPPRTEICNIPREVNKLKDFTQFISTEIKYLAVLGPKFVITTADL